MIAIIKTLILTLTVVSQHALSQCKIEKQIVNIEARVYDDKYACTKGVPIVVTAPNKIKKSKMNAAILTISNDEYHFQSNLKFVPKIDDLSDGVFFCSSIGQLRDISIRFLYGSSDCKGYNYRYEVNGFDKVLDGFKVNVSE